MDQGRGECRRPQEAGDRAAQSALSVARPGGGCEGILILYAAYVVEIFTERKLTVDAGLRIDGQP